jgi:hypothetical protein
VSAVGDAAQSREEARGELERLKERNEEEARRLEEVVLHRLKNKFLLVFRSKKNTLIDFFAIYFRCSLLLDLLKKII